MQGDVTYRLAVLQQLSKTVSEGIKEAERLKKAEELQKRICKNEIDLEEEVRNFEINLIRFALFQNGGNQTKAANMLNTKLSTLNSKIKRYGIKFN